MTAKMIDTKWGRLTVLCRSEITTSDKLIHYLCHCDCGRYTIIKGSRLRNGETRSCGCLAKELTSERSSRINRTHGMTKTPTYQSWQAMKNRCYRKQTKGYNHYGGRGITVCDRWLNSFESFLEDMGERPDGHTIDRIDVNGNYELSNCKWSTTLEQANNKRNKNEL